MDYLKLAFIVAAAGFIAISCTEHPPKEDWCSEENTIISADNDVLQVVTVSDEEGRLFLRKVSRPLSASMIESGTYAALTRKMVATVTDPSQDGVGIAGPQVGISRRIVSVQRLDKEGEPFETYPNIRITAMRGTPEIGSEGCLSVPGIRGNVKRSRDIDISYTSPLTLNDTTERIQGFTAVIFQHECDHLDGILYTDRICNDNL